MKKITLFLLLLCCTHMVAQLRLESNEKSSCTVDGDDIQCLRNPVKTVFIINLDRILQEDDSQKTSFTIDSKTIQNRETILYKVHTATGERFDFTVLEYSIKIQPLVYKNQYTEFEL